MEFPATGSGLLAATVLLVTGPAAGPGGQLTPPQASNNDFAAFVIVANGAHHGDYIGIVSNAPSNQTEGTLHPGEAGLRWQHAYPWPASFEMKATEALGIDNNPGHVPGLGLQRDYNIQLEPWAKYDYSAIVGPPAQLRAGTTIQAAQYELIYKLTFPPDAQGNPRIGYLHAKAVTGPGAARDLEWFVPDSVLTEGNLSQPAAVRRHMIDLRPATSFDAVPGPVQVGGLVKHADAVK